MPKYMKAVAVFEGERVEVVDDLLVPQVSDYTALVRIRACGLCNGTDMHIINGTLTKGEGLGDFPTILGHEGCGDVVEIGKKVRHIKIGDRFMRPYITPTDKYSITYGNMAQYGLVADHQAMLEDGYAIKDLPYYGDALRGFSPGFARVPDEISFEDGSSLLNLTECYNACTDFGIGEAAAKGDVSVLIFGAGPMGLGNMGIMRALGVKRIVAVDGIADRLELAKKVAHVDKTINIKETTVEEALGDERFDFTFDTVGSIAILESSSQFLKPRGKVCNFGGLTTGKDMLNVHHLANNVSFHTHTQPYKRFEQVPDVAKFVAEGKLNPKDFYSHVMPMDDVKKAIEMVRSKEAYKVILTID